MKKRFLILVLAVTLAGCSNLHVKFTGTYCGEEMRDACAK